ncbi:MAG: 30S ribosome-binding factor RbfA [Rhodospirillales bacterium]|nr:30S ribosome-binding factor RbfA [Rhodospirillales bacterium]
MARKRSTSKGPRGSSQRQLRVGEEIRHAIVEILFRGHLRDPDLQGISITVSEVRASPDLKHATAYIMPLAGGDAEVVLKALVRARAYLRTEVARAVRLRFAPELHFALDTSFDYATRIDAALRRPEVQRDLTGGPDDDPDEKA